jgi:hypothetical protein
MIKEFNNIRHNNPSDMSSLTFFLGSSNPNEFSAINGYYYMTQLRTQNGAYLESASSV